MRVSDGAEEQIQYNGRFLDMRQQLDCEVEQLELVTDIDQRPEAKTYAVVLSSPCDRQYIRLITVRCMGPPPTKIYATVLSKPIA